MEKKENLIIRWLKRISFSQVIAITVAIIGVVIAYKTLIVTKESVLENKSGELSVELYNPNTEETINIKNANIINILAFSYLDLEFISDNEKYAIYLPHLSNKTSKTLNDFRYEISIEAVGKNAHIFEIVNNISQEFSCDSINERKLQLKYKEDILRAHETLPVPISETSWIEDRYSLYILNYHITYDGIDESLDFSIYLSIFYCDYEKVLDKDFLTNYLDNIKNIIDIESDDEINNNIVMIYSDGDDFAIINDKNFLEENIIEDMPFYKVVSKMKNL